MKLGALVRETVRLGKLVPTFLDTRKEQNQRGGNFKTVDRVVEDMLKGDPFAKVNLIGHSGGAIEALDYALDNPQNVGELVLVAPPIRGAYGAYLGLLMHAFGIYSPRLDQLRPESDFVYRFNAKILRKWFNLGTRVWIKNVIADEDEFVNPKRQTLTKIVGNYPTLKEVHVPEGHCEAFFCETTRKLMDKVVRNGSKTVMLHGLEQNMLFLTDYLVTLTDEERRNVETPSYDYMKPMDERPVIY